MINTTQDTLSLRRYGAPLVRMTRAIAILVGAALWALLTGCAVLYPPIDANGNNCESYGVSEKQNAPMNCPIGSDGLPLIESVSYAKVQQLCIGDAPVATSFYTWGCVIPDGTQGSRGYAVTKAPKVYRHEQCHCLLGPGHNANY